VTRNRVLLLAAVLAIFFGVGAYLIFQGVGGGGQAVSIDLTVSGHSMAPTNPGAVSNDYPPSTVVVKQGDRVTMTIRADQPEEVHLHGYDIAFAVPGVNGKVTHTFTADKTGSFPMEIEETSTPLGQFVVTP